MRNYIGNIPVKWYDDYDHIGYDLEGNKIPNMSAKKKGEIDSFLEKMEDPTYWFVFVFLNSNFFMSIYFLGKKFLIDKLVVLLYLQMSR